MNAATKIKACTGTCFCKVAGDVGFEPTHVGIKIRCLNQLGESPTSSLHGDWKATIMQSAGRIVNCILQIFFIYLKSCRIKDALPNCGRTSSAGDRTTVAGRAAPAAVVRMLKTGTNQNRSCAAFRIAAIRQKQPELRDSFAKQRLAYHCATVADVGKSAADGRCCCAANQDGRKRRV